MEVLDEAVAHIGRQRGLFTIRCSCHSLQLLLKDLRKSKKAPFVQKAMDLVDCLVEDFKNLDAVAKLLDVQRSSGVKSPLRIIRPGETRWNSYVDAFKRLEKLKRYLPLCSEGEDAVAITEIKDAHWKAVESAILLLAPVAASTDRIQGDDADARTIAAELDVLEKHFISLQGVAGCKAAATEAHRLLKKRMAKNFSYDALALVNLLDPRVNQKEIPSETRKTQIDLLLRYMKARASRRGLELDTTEVARQVGRFLMRPRETIHNEQDFKAFWEVAAASETELAEFALVLCNIVASEAAVERSFSTEARILTKLRTSTHQNVIDAQMFVAMNWERIMQPGKVLERKRKAMQKAEKRAKEEEKDIQERVAKRKRQ